MSATSPLLINKKMKTFFLFSLLCLYSIGSRGQNLRFYKNGGGEIRGQLYSSLQLSDGYILCGYRSYVYEELYVVRTDQEGTVLWTKFYNPGYYCHGRKIIQVQDGNFVITGGRDQTFLIKIDPMGNVIWSRHFKRNYLNTAKDVCELNNGDLVLVGNYMTSSSTSGDSNIQLIRTDSNGNLKWSRRYGGPQIESGLRVTGTSDNHLLITGTSSTYGGALLMKADTSGIIVWSRQIGGLPMIQFQGVHEMQSGEYLFAGYRSVGSAGTNPIILVLTDVMGNPIQTRSIQSTTDYILSSSVKCTDGGIALCGIHAGIDPKGFLLKTDAALTVDWSREYESPENFIELYGVTQASDQGFLLSGRAKKTGAINATIAWLKTDTLGTLDCYNHPIMVDDTAQIYSVTAPAVTNANISVIIDSGFTVIPYPETPVVFCQNVGIIEQTGVEEIFLFPNPASGHFDLSSDEKILDIRIYNLHGQLMPFTFLSTHRIDCSKFSPGIFLVDIHTKNGNMRRTLVIQ
jgi:hypothetical protein